MTPQIPQIPDGVRPEIVAAAVLILANLRETGWEVHAIQWEDRAIRTLGFFAKRGGDEAYIVCFEVSLLAEQIERENQAAQRASDGRH